MNDLFEKLSEPNSENIKVKKTKTTVLTTPQKISQYWKVRTCQKKTRMYIGGVDSRALHHLFNEVIDNAVDEVVAGHASAINVILNRNNELIIGDNGRGNNNSHPFPKSRP